jgi:PhnB protein
MKTNIYLSFDGRCEEAFQFYAKVLGGKFDAKFPFRGTPAESQTPPEWLDKLMHAKLDLGESILMGSDAPPQRYQKPQGLFVNLDLRDAKEAERLYQALSEGATVIMPLQSTFWAAKFAMLVDRFGIPWMINCEANA